MSDDNAGGGAGSSWPPRWRKVGLAAGSVLAAGGLVFGGAMIAVLTHPPARHAPRAVIGWFGTVSPVSPAPSGTTYMWSVTTVPPTTAAGPAMTTSQIIAALRTLLPSASTMSYIQGTSVGGVTDVASEYNDGQGNVAFSIAIMPSYLSPPAFPMNCSDPFGTGSQDNVPAPPGGLPPSCVIRNLMGGITERDVVTPVPPGTQGAYDYEISLQRPDGVEVILTVSNTADSCWLQANKTGSGSITVCPTDPAFLPRPPGSMAEWEAVAESPVWRV